MNLTLTQAILFYYDQIKFDKAKTQEFESIFLPLLLDGLSSTNRPNYRLFCHKFHQMGRNSKLAIKRLSLQILDETFEENTFFDPQSHDQFDSYRMPNAYYMNPSEFIESHRNKNPTPEFENIIYTIAQDHTRRVFESSLAWSALANIPNNFPLKILEWNEKVIKFINLLCSQLTCDEIYKTRRYASVYERLSKINLSIDSFPPYKDVFTGRMLWETDGVAHEVYDILKLACQQSLQAHDQRMTLERRETFKAVALSWLLIRMILDLFNTTLHLKDVFDQLIDIPNFRGRVMVPESSRGDRAIAPPDHSALINAVPWSTRELGIIRGRTPLPYHSVSQIQPSDIPTYFTIPDPASAYTFPKALENCYVNASSCWATFCREQKMHPSIGGGSGSFFYISRVLLSLQDKNFYSSLFPGLSPDVYGTIDVSPCFTYDEFCLFIRILACLWVGISGGHCFNEILFTLNMQPVVDKYKDIFNFDSSSNLMTLLVPSISKTDMRGVLNQVSDYNTNRIFHTDLQNRFTTR